MGGLTIIIIGGKKGGRSYVQYTWAEGITCAYLHMYQYEGTQQGIEGITRLRYN